MFLVRIKSFDFGRVEEETRKMSYKIEFREVGHDCIDCNPIKVLLRSFPSDVFGKVNLNLNLEKFKVQVRKILFRSKESLLQKHTCRKV